MAFHTYCETKKFNGDVIYSILFYNLTLWLNLLDETTLGGRGGGGREGGEMWQEEDKLLCRPSDPDKPTELSEARQALKK